MTPADLGAIKQRLDQLEATQTQLTQSTREIDKFGVISAMEKELVTAYSTLMDANQPLLARVKQVEQLKRYGYFDDNALRAVTDLYQATENLNEKAGVLNALRGNITPALRDQILTDLDTEVQGGNQAPRFRYTAIEALEPMAQDSAVQPWLQHLAQSDPEPKLAARAAQALGLAPERSPEK
jgi:hypothetical protein